jgi:hypothetical protein
MYKCLLIPGGDEEEDNFFVGKIEAKNHFKDQDEDGRVIVKCVLEML